MVFRRRLPALDGIESLGRELSLSQQLSLLHNATATTSCEPTEGTATSNVAPTYRKDHFNLQRV